MARLGSTLSDTPAPATLEPVRFGEFLRDRALITEEQWLAALAAHWSASHRRRIGDTVIQEGFLAREIVEREARAFHDDLEIVEVEHELARSEKTTLPLPGKSPRAALAV